MRKRSTTIPTGLLALLAILVAMPAPTRAAETVASAWAEEEQSAVRLIAARDGLGADGEVRAGLEFRLQPGWKVYWRAPGDAGYPPNMETDGSTNAEAGPFAWPAPLRFSVLGLETLGYEDAVILPFTLSAPDPGNDSWLQAKVRYLTCREICIPYEADLFLHVPAGGGAPTAFAHAISRFESQVPRSADAAHMGLDRLTAAAQGKALYIDIRASSDIPFQSPDVYLEGPLGLGYGAPKVVLDADGRRAALRVPVSGFQGTPADAAQSLRGQTFTATLVDGRRATEMKVTLEAAAEGAGGAVAADSSLPLMLAFALLGGLILNLMPCVLPVLSIKLLSVLKHGGGHPSAVRTGFLASAAGIVAAFGVLAAALIALKAAGAGIGWGIQFQQPWFLIAMAFAVTLFACNLWGFFEFRLPAAFSRLGTVGNREGLTGHFLQGVFATLLATPCSAPFLGTAVGFALARGAGEIAAIFAALGIGLALPYLLVAAAPGLATRLPKPGAWMIRLRALLGFALAATAVWLLSVIMGAAGPEAAVATGVALLVLCLWFGLIRHGAHKLKPLTPVAVLVLVAAALGGAYTPSATPTDSDDPAAGKIAWQPFDPDALARHVADGKTVFVDVTADWCITCQVNKGLVLERPPVLDLLNDSGIVVMQADWTRPDPAIAAYLASFGRYGIPFNAVYGPRAPTGVALPELLSTEAVIDGLRAAAPDALAARLQ